LRVLFQGDVANKYKMISRTGFSFQELPEKVINMSPPKVPEAFPTVGGKDAYGITVLGYWSQHIFWFFVHVSACKITALGRTDVSPEAAHRDTASLADFRGKT